MRGVRRIPTRADDHVDPRAQELFDHLRAAIDVLEQMVLQPYSRPASARPESNDEKPVHIPVNIEREKLAYTVKEVRNLVGLSHSKLYRAMQNKELRAVKCGHRTLIMAKDLQTWIGGWPERS